MAKTESRTVVLLALAANVAIAAVKFVAAGVSGSAAMLAEGFHSLADSGNQLFLLRGTRASRFLPSVRFPFGQGKEIYFWSFLVAVVLFVGGGVVAFMEGLNRLRHPHPQEGGLAFNLIVLGIAAFFELVVAFRAALREFNRRRGTLSLVRSVREGKDPVLLVVLFEDSVAVVGLTVAALGLLLTHWTGSPTWDAVASMIIGLLLAVTAWILAIETKGLLVGESAGREVRSAIHAATMSVPGVETISRLLTMHLGPDEVLVNMDLVLEHPSPPVEETVRRVEEEIRRLVPQATRIFIEAVERS